MSTDTKTPQTFDVTQHTKPLMPKWQLILSYILLGFIVLTGLLFFAFKNNIFKALIKPPIPFQVTQEPAKPDYNNASAWILSPQTANPQKAAVFYVHPSTFYRVSSGWNAQINDAAASKIIDEIVIPNHISPFMENTQIWVPHYRQASLYSMLSFNEDSEESLNLAYHDIYNAFNAFLQHKSPNQKIIIAGMNQGALHILRLLQDLRPELKKQIIAVYLIDQALPLSLLDNSKGKNLLNSMTLCHNIHEYGCIMNFSIISKNNKRKIYIARKYSPVYNNTDGYYKRAKEAAACTNPLNGGSQDYADEVLNTGAVAASKLEEDTDPALLPAATDALCKDGLLLVDGFRPSVLSPPVFTLGSFYKVSPYNLFYDNIKTDVENRINAFNQYINEKK